MTDMRFYVIRHGKTRGNAEHRYEGRTDSPLTQEGREELLKRKASGVYTEAMQALDRGALLICSPLGRCRETAGLLFPGREPVILDELREVDFGTFEGKSHDELSSDAYYQAWIDSGGSLPFPEGEDRNSYPQRVGRGLERARSLAEKEGCGEVVMVAHGGTMMSMNYLFHGEDFFSEVPANGTMKVYYSSEVGWDAVGIPEISYDRAGDRCSAGSDHRRSGVDAPSRPVDGQPHR